MRVPLEAPPGLQGDDTTFAAQGRWADASCVRFRLGKPETIGGWESLTTTLLTGVCRSVFPFTDNTGTITVGFGTHSNLQLWQGGGLYDITPTLALPPRVLGTDPLSCANGSAVYTVSHNGHGYTAGETVTISGAAGCGRQVLSGNYVIASPTTNSYQITASANAVLGKTLGSNPLSVTLNSVTVSVTDTGHNIENGALVAISGAAAVGGITPNGTFAISVIDANTYSYSFTSPATSTTTGGGASVVSTPPATGGGSALQVQNTRAYAAGQIDGTGTSGFGTGGFGVGGYGMPSTTDYFPRTWSFGAWGQNLLACPRGGTIYAWTNDTAAVAQPLLNAPANVQHLVVAPNSGGYEAFAIGCNQEVSGVFNPMCIRHSSVRDDTTWTTSNATTAREYVLVGGGRLVAGRMCGPYLLVWSNRALYIGEFTGALDAPWTFTEVAVNCGLIGPNAAVVHGHTAFWISPDRQFYSYSLGGQPTPIACPIRDDFSENLAASQGDKIVASTCAEFSEVRFDYPDQRDGTGYENSRYLVVNVAAPGMYSYTAGPDTGAWSRGIMARTAYVDAGAAQYPIGVTYAGNAYFHEKGQSADGAAFSWFIETADCYLDENKVMTVLGVWPDIFQQQGPLYVEVQSRFFPQDTPTSTGALLMAVGAQKVDFRQTGRLHRVKLSGNSGPTSARLGKLDFEVTPGGQR